MVHHENHIQHIRSQVNKRFDIDNTIPIVKWIIRPGRSQKKSHWYIKTFKLGEEGSIMVINFDNYI